MFSKHLFMKGAALGVCASICTVAMAQIGSVTGISSPEVVVNTNNGSVTITAYSDSIVRVLPRLAGNQLAPKASASVIATPKAQLSVSETAQSVNVSTKALTVKIDKTTGMASFVDNNGEVLLSENASTAKDADGKTVYSFSKGADEAFYGGGERPCSVDLNGKSLLNYNEAHYGYIYHPDITGINITIPYYISTKGYGVYFDDYCKSVLSFEDGIKYTTNLKNPVPYFFMLGDKKNLAPVVKHFTDLTGHQDLPAFWAFGYITSKYGYKTQDEVMAVVDTLKTQGYPLDGVVLDLYWFGIETDMGKLDWDKSHFPDHKAMIKTLKDKGINMMLVSEPFFNKLGGIDSYNELAKKGLLVVDAEGKVQDPVLWIGESGLIDISKQEARDWMWAKYKATAEDGVNGFWGDLGEPEKHLETIVHSTGETAEEYHNRFGNDWARTVYEGFKKDYPDQRYFLIMRAGTAGLQHYNVCPWSGDISRSWEGLQAQVPLMINTQLSGLGYESSDIGGFAVQEGMEKQPELYLRWLQLGLFNPILRTHAQKVPEPYLYTEDGMQDIIKGLVKARYNWLPYIYTLAFENSTTGAPFNRSINYYEADNKALDNCDSEYLWGENVLVAPVMTKGATSRSVIFPKGKWHAIDKYSEVYTDSATVPTPLDRLPAYVRDGAIIPMANYEMNNVTEYNPAKLNVLYYPSAEKTTYALFEDDRTSTGTIERGEYNLINFAGQEDAKTITFTAELSGKGYATAPASHDITVSILGVKKAKKVTVNGKKASYKYDAKRDAIDVKVSLTTAATVKVVK